MLTFAHFGNHEKLHEQIVKMQYLISEIQESGEIIVWFIDTNSNFFGLQPNVF